MSEIIGIFAVQKATVMEKRFDFLSLMSSEINEKGIVVLDTIDRMPVYNEPYVSPCYVIAINHAGKVNVEYDGLAMTFTPHDIAVVYPNHELFCRNTSHYKATLIVVSEGLFTQRASINTSRGRFWHENMPHFHLTDSQYADIMSIVRSLQTVLRQKDIDTSDFAVWQMHILSTLISSFRSENEKTPSQSSSDLSPRFYQAIKEHCRQHHDVGFYADLFCLTPKYFSTLIQTETGHPAGHWIRQHLATQAKIMLRTEKEMRLNEIADELGFPDLATFSRYFRRETGISPSEYKLRVKS